MTEHDLISNLHNLGIIVGDTQMCKLAKYYELLIECNEKVNLTSIVAKKDVYLKHFYDSATLGNVVDLGNGEKSMTLCDVGTGAGFPGIVLKILFPDLKVTLIDSLNKRVNFLNLIIEKLELTDIKAIHARAEEYAISHREKYDIVTARAVASLPVLLEYTVPLVKVGGYFISMKGNISQNSEELGNAYNAIKVLNLEIEQIEEFVLPYEGSNRTLIKFKKLKGTDKKYPRKFSEIKKKSL